MVGGTEDFRADGGSQMLSRPDMEQGVQPARSQVMGCEKGGMSVIDLLSPADYFRCSFLKLSALLL